MTIYIRCESSMTTLKQILKEHVIQEKTFKIIARKWLQQKPLKLNYLTEKETKMSEEMVNLQIVLGLQSCETKKAVCRLLNDVRVDERKRLLEELEH